MYYMFEIVFEYGGDIVFFNVGSIEFFGLMDKNCIVIIRSYLGVKNGYLLLWLIWFWLF